MHLKGALPGEMLEALMITQGGEVGVSNKTILLVLGMVLRIECIQIYIYLCIYFHIVNTIIYKTLHSPITV